MCVCVFQTLNTELLSLMSSAEEVYVLQAWSLIVELLGKVSTPAGVLRDFPVYLISMFDMS